ncbi:hypothetical protein OG900_19410 [Streptomyces sp. NBC_00433]
MKASDPAEAAPPEEDVAEVAEEAAEAEEEVTPGPVAEGGEEDEDEDRGEPLFEVSDRRATILADRVGIVFRLDGEEADFTWDEIGAVEIETPRFSKRFEVTVYTGPRRWFEAHVEARSRGLLKTWTAELDAVLDEHFEDPEEKAAAAEEEAGSVAEATESTESTEATETAAKETEATEDGKTAAEA